MENSNIKKLRVEELRTLLISQKYLKNIVTPGIKKASIVALKIQRSEKAEKEKKKEKEQVLPFISTYSPNSPNLFPFIDCKHQQANLGKLLCSSKLTLSNKTFTVSKCGNSFCCRYI